MTKKKSTKRSLLLSGVSLLLCASMFVGSTFAWFTDTVSSGRNIIQSGNLDVELYYAATAADAQAGNWTKVDKDTDIFGYELWEPGHTRIAYFKVANEGSLALKYQLTARVFSETAGKNKIGEGETFLLSDYIYTKVIDLADNADRDDILAITDGTPLKGSINLREEAGELLAAEEGAESADIIGLAIWMPTSVGNVANHDGESIPSIEFGVNLIATQLDAEFDSFGPDYDEGAMDDGVKTVENGIEYIYTADGEVILNRVLPEYASDTVVVPAGVTSIGYGTQATGGTQAFAYNKNVKTVIFSSSVTNIGYQAFKDSAVEKVVLNEGLTEIGEFAFNGAKSLKEFNIPSTVKTIGLRAFRQTAATELVVHAGIESISESFRDMSNLTTVTIHGNTHISDFSFRDCPALRTVYLLGDNITMTGGTVFCNASTNNPNVNDITFYVTNDTVADRVRTVMGKGTTFDIIVMSTVNSADELAAALAAKESVIALSGDCITDESFVVDYDVTIVGNGTTISREEGFTGTVFTVKNGAALTLENVTVDGGAVWTSTFASGGAATNSGATATGNLIAAEANAKIVLGEGAVLQNNDGAHAVNLGTRIGATLTLNGGEIIYNRSDSGAVWGGGHITINSGKISYNSSTGIGGAIRMVSNCNLTMNGGEISYNTAAGNGGAIWGYGSSIYKFNGGEMAFNESAGAGGGIYFGDYSEIYLSGDVEIHDNTAASGGGAFRVTNYTIVNMTGGKIYNNTSADTENNNGFYGWCPRLTITGGELSDNIAIDGGHKPTLGGDGITGKVSFYCDWAYLTNDFGVINYTADSDSFCFYAASDYTYTEGDEAKLVCLNEGYTTYWNAEKNAFCLKAE